jgi:hypothetical protein
MAICVAIAIGMFLPGFGTSSAIWLKRIRCQQTSWREQSSCVRVLPDSVGSPNCIRPIEHPSHEYKAVGVSLLSCRCCEANSPIRISYIRCKIGPYEARRRMRWPPTSARHGSANTLVRALIPHRLKTYTTTIVMKNPASTRNMPIVLRCGIALLNRQTHAQAIQVAIFRMVSERKAFKTTPLSSTL